MYLPPGGLKICGHLIELEFLAELHLVGVRLRTGRQKTESTLGTARTSCVSFPPFRVIEAHWDYKLRTRILPMKGSFSTKNEQHALHRETFVFFLCQFVRIRTRCRLPSP